jgi:hypothetical protein
MATRTVLIVFLCLVNTTLGLDAPTVQWGRQLVTPTKDSIFGAMAVDSKDGIYIAVSRSPSDASDSKAKDYDLLKFDQNGTQVWSRRLGGRGEEDPLPLVVEGLAADNQENIYVFGYTDSKLGQEKKGGNDVFVAQYNQAGTQQWVRQMGTPEHDVCTGLEIDTAGNLYIAGYTYGTFAQTHKGQADIFVAAYSPTGTLLWQDQMGTEADDRALDLHLGNHNDLYVCGNTNGALAGENKGEGDIVVARYERTGKSLWLQQYGTEKQDVAICIEVSEQGHVYVGGRTHGDFNRAQIGYGDAFVVRIADTGRMLWQRQFGSHYWDQTWDMACFQDGSGDILVGGCQIPSQICQGFCRRYSPEGKLIWIKEFRKRSSKGGTCGRVVAIDSDNNCYHAGVTNANQFGVNNGTGNIYLTRFDDMPEKATDSMD